jgi:hypothetical protein
VLGVSARTNVDSLADHETGSTVNSRRIVGGIVIAAVASVLVYAVMIALTDAPAAVSALQSFPLPVFAAMLALSLGCFVLRAWRWGRLTGLVGFQLSASDALYQQISGQTMTVTPGRVGEVLKPWLANQTVGLPMTQGVALVFAERVADLIAVCILSLGGVSVIGSSRRCPSTRYPPSSELSRFYLAVLDSPRPLWPAS